MKPVIVLFVVFGAALLTTWIISGHADLLLSGNIAMGIMLCFTALGHFKFTQGMVLMIPPFIPYRTPLVYLTGVAEILLGVALLIPAIRSYAGYAVMLFFIVLLPANIYAASKKVNIEKGTFDGPGLSYLWFRIPVQLFFILWVYHFSIYPISITSPR